MTHSVLRHQFQRSLNAVRRASGNESGRHDVTRGTTPEIRTHGKLFSQDVPFSNDTNELQLARSPLPENDQGGDIETLDTDTSIRTAVVRFCPAVTIALSFRSLWTVLESYIAMAFSKTEASRQSVLAILQRQPKGAR